MSRSTAYVIGIGIGVLILILNKGIRRDIATGFNGRSGAGSSGSGGSAAGTGQADCGCNGSQNSIPEVIDATPFGAPPIEGRISAGFTPSTAEWEADESDLNFLTGGAR